MNEQTKPTVQEMIEAKLSYLAHERMKAEVAHEMKMQAERNFWARPENAELLETQKAMRASVERLENELRELILPTFDPDKGKKFNGYGFRETVKIDIPDEKQALSWCLTNFTPALSLNKKIFNAAAKQGTIPDELATVKTELTVTIATNLSNFITEKDG